MQHTPRYPLGTRVSKYFPGYKEPFAGVVDDYSTYSHFYHITYEDGDSEEMTEEDLHIHVIHVASAPPARSASEPVNKKPMRLTLNDKAPGVGTSSRSNPNSVVSSPTSSSPRGSQPRSQQQQQQQQPPATSSSNRPAVVNTHYPVVSQEEVNKLIGVGISKLFVGDDGRETIVSGTVSAYFIATRKYRVLFFNGVCEDLSYQDVIESIPLSSPSDEESKKRKLADGGNGATVPSASPKKQKVFESNNDGTAAESAKKKSKETDRKGGSESVSELSPPFDSIQGLTKAAHNITRSVLYVVVSASPKASGDGRKELQLEVLTDGNLKVGTRYNLLLYGREAGREAKVDGRLVMSVNSVLTISCVLSWWLSGPVCLSRSRRKHSRSLSKKAGWLHWKDSYRNGRSLLKQSMACLSSSRCVSWMWLDVCEFRRDDAKSLMLTLVLLHDDRSSRCCLASPQTLC